MSEPGEHVVAAPTAKDEVKAAKAEDPASVATTDAEPAAVASDNAVEENASEGKTEAAGEEGVKEEAGVPADTASKTEGREGAEAQDGGEVENPEAEKKVEEKEDDTDGKGGQFVGRLIKKKFGRKKYLGKVLLFEEDEGWYKVRYEDGDEEELEAHEIRPLLLTCEMSEKVVADMESWPEEKRATFNAPAAVSQEEAGEEEVKEVKEGAEGQEERGEEEDEEVVPEGEEEGEDEGEDVDEDGRPAKRGTRISRAAGKGGRGKGKGGGKGRERVSRPAGRSLTASGRRGRPAKERSPPPPPSRPLPASSAVMSEGRKPRGRPRKSEPHVTALATAKVKEEKAPVAPLSAPPVSRTRKRATTTGATAAATAGATAAATAGATAAATAGTTAGGATAASEGAPAAAAVVVPGATMPVRSLKRRRASKEESLSAPHVDVSDDGTMNEAAVQAKPLEEDGATTAVAAVAAVAGVEEEDVVAEVEEVFEAGPDHPQASLVGRQVLKSFRGMLRRGVVNAFDSQNGMYMVEYEKGRGPVREKMGWKLLEGFLVIGDDDGDVVEVRPADVSEVEVQAKRQRVE